MSSQTIPPPGAVVRAQAGTGKKCKPTVFLFRIIAAASLLTVIAISPLRAETALEMKIAAATPVTQWRTDLYPSKEPVKGFWGTKMRYRPGMIMIRLLCSPSDMHEKVAVNPEEERPGEVVTANRLELFKLNDDDEWKYIGWYRFISMNASPLCKNLRDTALLLNGENRLILHLKILDSGLDHRNVVEKWSLQ